MQEIITSAIDFIHKEEQIKFEYVYRVWELSKLISKFENANNLVVELSAILYDYTSDFTNMINNSPNKNNSTLASKFITSNNLNPDLGSQILNNINFVSDPTKYNINLEAKVFYDAYLIEKDTKILNNLLRMNKLLKAPGYNDIYNYNLNKLLNELYTSTAKEILISRNKIMM